ncbi:oxidoreductase [Aphelenchoides avenae]|nr:oxidoreductase [Aphelenchus avenae]
MVCFAFRRPRRTKMPTLRMSNGVELPMLGYGTWNATDPEKLKVALRAALDVGYRYIDTAIVYGNEQVIGDVIKEYTDAGKLNRSDLFITSKLPGHMHEPHVTKQAIESSLKALRTEYIDLYLIHSPMPVKRNEDGTWYVDPKTGMMTPHLVPHIETWRVFESYYKTGKLRAIGLSNFSKEQTKDLFEKAEIKPHNVQVEIHLFFQQKELVNFCKSLGITVTSYSTLGSRGRFEFYKLFGPKGDSQPRADVLAHPLVNEMAKKYGKTPAQILLRQMIQRGINVIPKSVNPERVKENFEVFDFKLSDEDMKKFDNVKENLRLNRWFMLDYHPWYPFEK